MPILDGTEGNDSLVGGIGADTLNGLGGNDTLRGDFGDDLLDGGTGNDSLDGAYGNDTLLGGDGTDTLIGSFGDDSLTGGLGVDGLDGGNGNDTLVGDAGNDALSGGAGNDSLTGGGDHDYLNGDTGNDTLHGGLGNDTLYDNGGDAGSNQLFGEDGNDSLYGYGYGYSGTPETAFTMSGGEGNDTLYLAYGSGVLNGDAGDDVLRYEGSKDLTASLIGGTGNDSITVTDRVLGTSLDGGDGNDYLVRTNENTARNDTYIGGAGNDTIIDSNGANSISAGDDIDTVVYGGWGGADTIDLGSGNDTIQNLNATYAASITTGLGQDLLVIKAFSTSANNLTTITDFTPGAGGDVVDILTVLQSISNTGWDASSNPFATGFLRLVQSGADTLLQLDPNGATGGEAYLTLLTFKNTTATAFTYANFVQDLPNSAPTDIALSPSSVRENSANGTVVGALSATDFDIAFGEVMAFSLVSDAGGRFAISGSNLVVANGALLDRETALTHSVTVRVTDSHGATYDEAFVVSLTNQPGVTITGSLGDDLVNVTHTVAGQPLPSGEEDLISGDAGADTLFGEGGNDTILGEAGHDSINGGAGRDSLSGGDGNDTIIGGFGNDSMDGGDGDDSFLVGTASGTDAFNGGAGNDRIIASANNANIVFSLLADIEAIDGAGFANVRITGSTASETFDFSSITLTGIAAIDGGNGKDTITGSSGNDTIIGGFGNDSLNGGDGDDTFLIGTASGIDAIIGGTGNDRILAIADNANIMFSHLSGIEAIDGAGFANVQIKGTVVSETLDFSGIALTAIAAIDGGNGKDTITGSSGNDTIIGGFGNDSLNGGDGDDTFLVGAASGTDAFIGGAGNDRIVATADNANIAVSLLTGIEEIDADGFTGVRISGTAGLDLIDLASVTLTGIVAIGGGNGKDTIIGSAGNDIIVGGGGADRFTGGAGADTFVFEKTSDSPRTTPDTITDFVQGEDLIDLSAIDADGIGGAANLFTWIGNNTFSGTAGELRFTPSGGNTLVQGDTNGDGVADIQIVLTGAMALASTDFLL